MANNPGLDPGKRQKPTVRKLAAAVRMDLLRIIISDDKLGCCSVYPLEDLRHLWSLPG